jgi:hypothetical protein
MKVNSCFIGVDVAFAKHKRLPIVICAWQGSRLVPYPLRTLNLEPPRGLGNAASINVAVVSAFADQAVHYVDQACRRFGTVPIRIALDAPSSPRSNGSARREAEVAMDRAGISCFTTPSQVEFAEIRHKVQRHLAVGGSESHLPHANQLWMLVGFELFKRFEGLAPCIEVFPQATVRALGMGRVHKFKPGAVLEQLRAAAVHTGWPASQLEEQGLRRIAWAPLHDCLDAYLSAWVAALDESARIPHGHAPDDVIWVPRVSAQPVRPAADSETRHAATSRQRLVGTADTLEKACPGCEQIRFKRWPWGWDAHAAYVCRGLVAVKPDERKREFKARFAHHFGGGKITETARRDPSNG